MEISSNLPSGSSSTNIALSTSDSGQELEDSANFASVEKAEKSASVEAEAQEEKEKAALMDRLENQAKDAKTFQSMSVDNTSYQSPDNAINSYAAVQGLDKGNDPSTTIDYMI